MVLSILISVSKVLANAGDGVGVLSDMGLVTGSRLMMVKPPFDEPP